MDRCHPIFVPFICISLVDMAKNFEQAVFSCLVINPRHFFDKFKYFKSTTKAREFREQNSLNSCLHFGKAATEHPQCNATPGVGGRS